MDFLDNIWKFYKTKKSSQNYKKNWSKISNTKDKRISKNARKLSKTKIMLFKNTQQYRNISRKK